MLILFVFVSQANEIVEEGVKKLFYFFLNVLPICFFIADPLLFRSIEEGVVMARQIRRVTLTEYRKRFIILLCTIIVYSLFKCEGSPWEITIIEQSLNALEKIMYEFNFDCLIFDRLHTSLVHH